MLESDQQRNQTIKKLEQNDVPTAIYYKYPIHLMKGFASLGYQKDDFPISESLKNTILSLPIHPYLSEKEVDLIISIIP